MYCQNCGAPMLDGARFCGRCGAPVQHAGAESPDAAPQQAPSAAYPSAPQHQQPPQYPQQPPQYPQQPPQYPQQPPQYSQQQPQYPQQPLQYQQRTQYPQPQQYPQYPPQPYAAASKKRKLAVPIIALVLVAAILFTGLVSPGFFVKKSRAEALINRVQVHIPTPTGPEATVRLLGDVALQYYIQARLYLEKLSQYDVRDLSEEEFGLLVTNTLTALEDAEKISDFLAEAVDLWMECDDVREEPTYTVTQDAKAVATMAPTTSPSSMTPALMPPSQPCC